MLHHPCCIIPAGATLLSFVVALVHFITEVLIFKTMSIKGAATPMAIAGALDCSTCFLSLQS
jgi:hypothetical protein